MSRTAAPVRGRVVCQDPQVGLAPLFRLYNKARPRLDIRYEPAEARVSLHFRGPEALGVKEQTLMFVLLELAQEHHRSGLGSWLDKDTPSAEAKALWDGLYQHSRGELPNTIWFSTSWYELARRMGKTLGGTMSGQLKKQLKRLCECVVWERHKEDTGVFELQSSLVAMVYNNDQQLFVALNVRLAEAIIEPPYMPVSLAERQLLELPAAKAAHAFLSTWIRYGHSNRIGKNTLIERLWPAEYDAKGKLKPPPGGTQRRRRKDLKEALNEVDGLPGWAVSGMDDEVLTIRRAKAPDETKNGMTGQATHRRRRTSPRASPVAARDTSFCERANPSPTTAEPGFQAIDASALFA